MKEIILDTKNTQTIEELHSQVAKLFCFPDYYGKNLDALYDMITGEIELPVKLIWENYESAHKKIGKKLEGFKKVFLDLSRDEKAFLFEMR